MEEFVSYSPFFRRSNHLVVAQEVDQCTEADCARRLEIKNHSGKRKPPPLELPLIHRSRSLGSPSPKMTGGIVGKTVQTNTLAWYESGIKCGIWNSGDIKGVSRTPTASVGERRMLPHPSFRFQFPFLFYTFLAVLLWGKALWILATSLELWESHMGAWKFDHATPPYTIML